MTEVQRLKEAIAVLEAQRAILSDSVAGTALAPLRERLSALEGQSDSAVQRRGVATVLFADITHSTRMSQGLEPEEVLEVMDRALQRLAFPVKEHGGQVTRFMGDGFLAIFGLYVTREDDAQRAVQAGLEILRVAQVYAQELLRERQIHGFNVRVGISTGLVASGGFSEGEDTVMGLTVNLAARLQQAAPTGGVLISRSTFQHVRGAFEVEAQDPIAAKGFAEPVPVYLVRRARPHSFGPSLTGFQTWKPPSGDIAREVLALNQQVAINQQLGNREGETIGLTNLGYNYLQLGLYRMGIRALERSLEMAEALGHHRFSAYSRLNLGLAYLRGGDIPRAQQALEQSISELAAMSDTFGQAVGQSYLALAREQSGEVADALTCYANAWAVLREAGVQGYAQDAWAGSARCLLAQGQLDDARGYAIDLWNHLLEHGGEGMEFPLLAYQACADIFEAAGDGENARAAIRAGYRELLARARKISDPSWRGSFLENVPEHCRMFVRWKELASDSRPHQLLGQVPLFEDLPEPELERLAAGMHTVELPPETILLQQGDLGDRFYVVLQGQLEIFQAMEDEEERILAVRGKGEFIGELSLLNPDGRRTASVRSRGPAALWEMMRAEFERLIQRQPSLAYKIARVLSSRLTASQALAIRDLEQKNLQLTLASEELKAAQAQIIEKEKLERELELAHEIQMRILPQKLPQLPGYDFGARIVPARAVGGDFYDLIPLAAGRMGIVVGDVAGKGVPAAISMAQIHALLHASAHAASTSGEILQHVNRHFRAMGSPRLFATVLFGLLDTHSGDFTYARAGHEAPLLVTAEGEVYPLAWGVGQPLGILRDPILDHGSVTIPPGGTLLLYSDGIVDARNPQGEWFGRERLEESLSLLASRSAQELCDRLWETLVAFQGDCPQYDDVTLVAVRAAGSKTGE